jgi:hypothetical protein
MGVQSILLPDTVWLHKARLILLAPGLSRVGWLKCSLVANSRLHILNAGTQRLTLGVEVHE